MFRRVRKSDLHEARINDLKAAHMRLVVSLTDQIEFLRSQLKPSTGPPMPPWPDSPMKAISEEEEQLQALREFGHDLDPDLSETFKAHGINID
jgi:hypothetical protein